MISIETSLIIILIGAFVLMVGILLLKEPSRNFRSTLAECATWGAGFLITWSVQVALIATMS